jgi:NAD(P)-dependent dehydrogenase (short-subunit alcohol dehydrogenase family)
MGRLEGRAALITGGNSGIGLAAAGLFAQEGAQVFIAGRDRMRGKVAVESLRMRGLAAEFLAADVGEHAAVERLFSSIKERTGHLDVLFNNAGWGGRGSLAEEPLEQWQAVLNDNVSGTYYCCRAALPLLRAGAEASGGTCSIINVASIAALTGPDSRLSWHRMGLAYRTAKGAVLALTRALAVELGEHRIRVNALVPGIILTDRLRNVAAATPGYIESVLEGQALPFSGEPEDVARVAVFLASEEARFVTGAAIPVDGGVLAK